MLRLSRCTGGGYHVAQAEAITLHSHRARGGGERHACVWGGGRGGAESGMRVCGGGGEGGRRAACACVGGGRRGVKSGMRVWGGVGEGGRTLYRVCNHCVSATGPLLEARTYPTLHSYKKGKVVCITHSIDFLIFFPRLSIFSCMLENSGMRFSCTLLLSFTCEL